MRTVNLAGVLDGTFLDAPVQRMDRRHSLCWLEEINYVARRIYAENLFATPLLHNIVSEFYTFVLEL